MRLLGGAGLLAVLAACSSSKKTLPSSSTTTTGSPSSTTTRIPQETAGPYPGDGSNGPDALTADGVVRRDITRSFGSASGVAEGVPTAIKLALSRDGVALPGAAVYAWHCDRDARYSMYSPGAEDQNYLRGIQPTNTDGVVEFASIFPACYSGRWPHVHFEVYSSVADATGGGSPIVTSQIALPEDVCSAAYARPGYEQSVRNLSEVSLDGDMVFGDDGGVHELATVTGDASTSYVIALNVPV
jgi:protocatechuate 3,4-dioxygenase beta subunit